VHITFTTPMSGLAPLTDFELAPLEGPAGLYTLRSIEQPSTRLFVLDPRIYVPGYEPDLPGSADSTRILVVVTPRSGGPTVNLLAPIVIDTESLTARQVVLADDIDRVRTPLASVMPVA
jgi:flagellar assembly factor FliW